MRITSALLACAALAGMLAAPAYAQEGYPSRPVRMVVPYPPGGSVDGIARLILPSVSASLGQQVVIDNRGGAGGIIGTSLVARALPDGYTLMMVFDLHAVNPSVHKDLPYDTLKDFTPVTLVATTPMFMIVHPGVPAADVKQFVAYARARPDELTYASSGAGSQSQIAAELFKQATKVEIRHIPYKGGGLAQIAVISGESKLMFGGASFSAPIVRNGRVKALGVSGNKRNGALPDVPTFAEQGVVGLDLSTWYGIFGPAGLPPAIVRRWQQEMGKAMRGPELERKLSDLGLEIVASSPEAFDRHIRREVERMGKLVRERNITME
jgi:tripartite-type tricarboxylate transporter receptor subunit TctC